MVRERLQEQMLSLWEEVDTARGDHRKNSFTWWVKSFIRAHCNQAHLVRLQGNGLSIHKWPFYSSKDGLLFSKRPTKCSHLSSNESARAGNVVSLFARTRAKGLVRRWLLWEEKVNRGKSDGRHIMSLGFWWLATKGGLASARAQSF